MSSYYGPEQWQTPATRQPSWDGQVPPRSGTSSTVPRDESTAFLYQIEEVDRAYDNLLKSGKMSTFQMGPRRDSMPLMMAPRPYADYGAFPQRHSISEFDPMRSHSATNLQGYYAAQRFQGRPTDEHMLQQKRRMAAQRERELRNFHQEQQYNRSLLAEMSNKADRSMSPMINDQNHRELLARQHRALYGGESSTNFYGPGFDAQQQGTTVPTSTSTAARGPSPRTTFDQYAPQANSGEADNPGPQSQNPGLADTASANPQQRSRANSNGNSSPASNTKNFGAFDAQAPPQSNRTSASSPGEASPRQPIKSSAAAPIGAGVAPIGTRPNVPSASQVANPVLNKRSTTPLPSPLGLSSYTSNNPPSSTNDQRSQSSTSNNQGTNKPDSSSSSSNVGLGWGSNSGVWGTKGTLGVQASVWG